MVVSGGRGLLQSIIRPSSKVSKYPSPMTLVIKRTSLIPTQSFPAGSCCLYGAVVRVRIPTEIVRKLPHPKTIPPVLKLGVLFLNAATSCSPGRSPDKYHRLHRGLTAVFGMGTGGSLSISSPQIVKVLSHGRYCVFAQSYHALSHTYSRIQNYLFNETLSLCEINIIIFDQALDLLVSVS